jgi:hypothetical protein
LHYILLIPLLTLISVLHLRAQTFERHDGESRDSLAARASGPHASPAGVFELPAANNPVILFGEVTMAGNGSRSFTTLNLLYPVKGKTYTRVLIDTVARSGSCWAPVGIDSVYQFNLDNDQALEIAVVLSHSPYCDAFKPYSSVLFFDDLEGYQASGKMDIFPNLTFTINTLPPHSEAVKKQIKNYLKTKGIYVE